MSDQESEMLENVAEGNEPSAPVEETNEVITTDVPVIIPEENKPFRKSWFGRFLFNSLFILFLIFCVTILPGYLQRVIVPMSQLFNKFQSNNETEMAEDKAILEGSIAKLQKELDDYVPESFYMIINSTDNEFELRKGREVFRKGKCSTGSYTVLEDPKKGKKYTFITPKGRRKVLSKVKDPVWTKPNWAFIEEGLPVPSATHPSRFEEGVLGDYALKLGDGYMIHGTIWQRYLGLPVTHGCVRLNDADLEVVHNSLNKGSFVYIY